jgi:hypothetical protein
MPAQSKRPSPAARVVELLKVEKRRLLAENGVCTHDDFRAAWEACEKVIIGERAFPHATVHRRRWWAALVSARPDYQAAFCDERTPFAVAAARFDEVAGGMCLNLTPQEIGRAMLASFALVADDEDGGFDEDATSGAIDAAGAFMALTNETEMAA